MMKLLPASASASASASRRLLLAVSALALVAGAIMIARDTEPPAPTTARVAARSPELAKAAPEAPPPSPATAPGQPATVLAQNDATTTVPDIFAVRTWEPPPPPAPPAMTSAEPPPPPPPQAPPLPFRFLGRILEAGKPPVFILALGEKVISVQVGDTVDDYKVLRQEGGELYFVYRPMQVQQSLTVGSGEATTG